jgi:hypothetical protein
MRIFITFALLFLSACSFYGIIGKNLDYIITDKLEDSFDLNGEQEKRLRKDIIQFLNQEKDFIKDLKSLVKSIATEIETGKTTEEKWVNLANEVGRVYLSAGEKFVPIMAKYLAELDDDQREEVYEQWDKENQKLKRRIKKEKVSSHRRRFEKLFGDFTPEMKKDFKKHKELLFSRNKKRLNRRLSSQQELKELMDGSGQNTKAISAAILKSMQSTFTKEDNQGYAKLFATMQKHISAKKKKDILTKLSQVEGILSIAYKYKY